MDEPPLYRRISAAVQQDILTGKLRPGDQLPSMREMMQRWNCTPGTVQRAYRDLSETGLAVARTGKGTFVAGGTLLDQTSPLRKAELVHRAETFILEALNSGHAVDEIEAAVRMALDRWRVVQAVPEPSAPAKLIRFAGSHDPAVAWLAEHFSDTFPGGQMKLEFSGSLGGLIALAEGKADLAGSHLWDEPTDSYNTAFVRRLLPGQRTALVNLAFRRLGLFVPPGNPQKITGLTDLTRPGLRFINRQPGSGTRVWLDAALHKVGIDSATINGYQREALSHSEVARAVAEGTADCGFGLETSALAYKLDFVFLTREEYQLVIPQAQLARQAVQALLKWLTDPAVKKSIEDMGGYETGQTGKIIYIEI